MSNPIFIPSKDRVTISKLIKWFNSVSVPNIYVVVEPQDYESYKNAFESITILQLNKNNEGISFARNFIVNYASENDMDWIWILDDDIDLVMNKIDSDNNITKLNTYSLLHSILDKPFESCFKIEPNRNIDKLAQIGFLNNVWLRQYNKYDVGCQTSINQIVALNIPLLKAYNINYCLDLKFREDVDLTLQILENGLLNVRYNNYGYSTQSNTRRNYNTINPTTVDNGGMTESSKTMDWKEQETILVKRFGKYISFNPFKVNYSSFKFRFYS